MKLSDLLVWSIRGYQRLISRYTPPMCRFEPTCSQYALVSFQRHGIFRGIWLTTSRLIRCNPFHPGGSDPVPDAYGICSAQGSSHRGGSVEH